MSSVLTAVYTTLIPRSPVFSTRDAAAAAGVGLDVASRALGRLAERGLLTRITAGVWADTRHPDFSPYAVVPVLLERREAATTGYVSLLSALNLHGMIEQIPRAIQVVVPDQRPAVETPVGRFEFHRLKQDLIDGFEPYARTGAFELATPEKALFDTLYLSARRGRRSAHLPELTLPRHFSIRRFEAWATRVEPISLRVAVRDRWQHVRLAQFGNRE